MKFRNKKTGEIREWGPVLINSALLSAQQRKRYYWTNWHVEQPQDKGILLKDILESGVINSEKITDKAPTQTCYCASQTTSSTVMMFQPVRVGQIGKGGQGDRIYSVRGKSVCLNANSGGRGAKTGLYKVDLPDGDYIIRKLTPVECERLQTLPDNYTAGVSNTQRYKAIGNGWTVDVIAWILGGIK